MGAGSAAGWAGGFCKCVSWLGEVDGCGGETSHVELYYASSVQAIKKRSWGSCSSSVMSRLSLNSTPYSLVQYQVRSRHTHTHLSPLPPPSIIARTIIQIHALPLTREVGSHWQVPPSNRSSLQLNGSTEKPPPRRLGLCARCPGTPLELLRYSAATEYSCLDCRGR